MTPTTQATDYSTPIELGPGRRTTGGGVGRVRQAFVWLCLLAASLVVAGVLLQAFSIAAYVRGAGGDALTMHQTGGFVTHSVEIVVFLTALVAYWRSWMQIGLALLLPVLGTLQIALIGDTDRSGGWINGLHGLLALIVLLLAVFIAQGARRSLATARNQDDGRRTP
jgi:hypothetical protein